MASACQEAKVMCETFIKFRSSQFRASLPWASTIDSNQYSWNKSIFLVFKKYWFLYWFGYWFGYWFWNRHIWSNLIQFDQIWSILIKFPLILIKFDQIWSNCNFFCLCHSYWFSTKFLVGFLLKKPGSKSIKFIDFVWEYWLGSIGDAQGIGYMDKRHQKCWQSTEQPGPLMGLGSTGPWVHENRVSQQIWCPKRSEIGDVLIEELGVPSGKLTQLWKITIL